MFVPEDLQFAVEILAIDPFRLMEHLDSLAGSIAYKHMLGPGVQSLGRIQDHGFYIVTASVDRYVLPIYGDVVFSNQLLLSLDMLAALNPTRDLRLSGQVIYTGRSSMEVAVKMESTGNDLPDETVMIGVFQCIKCSNVN